MKLVLITALALISTNAIASERICQYKSTSQATQVTTLDCSVSFKGKIGTFVADGHKFVAKLDAINAAPDSIVGGTLNGKPATFMRMGKKGFEIGTNTKDNITFGVVDDHPAQPSDRPYLGKWTIDRKKGCTDTDDSAMTFTPTEVKGYESSCTITSVAKSPNDYVYFIIGNCESEGEKTKSVTTFSGNDETKEINGNFYGRCPTKRP